MTEPEQAVERARAAAAAMRERGAYTDATAPAQETVTTPAKLLEWALIEPDLRDVRSTRRLGAPVTALKRLLVRLLEQYHAELNAQQTRFNVAVLGQLRELEERIEELERKLEGRDPSK
jgi:hypothetical protein